MNPALLAAIAPYIARAVPVIFNGIIAIVNSQKGGKSIDQAFEDWLKHNTAGEENAPALDFSAPKA